MKVNCWSGGEDGFQWQVWSCFGVLQIKASYLNKSHAGLILCRNGPAAPLSWLRYNACASLCLTTMQPARKSIRRIEDTIKLRYANLHWRWTIHNNVDESDSGALPCSRVRRCTRLYVRKLHYYFLFSVITTTTCMRSLLQHHVKNRFLMCNLLWAETWRRVWGDENFLSNDLYRKNVNFHAQNFWWLFSLLSEMISYLTYITLFLTKNVYFAKNHIFFLFVLSHTCNKTTSPNIGGTDHGCMGRPSTSNFLGGPSPQSP